MIGRGAEIILASSAEGLNSSTKAVSKRSGLETCTGATAAIGLPLFIFQFTKSMLDLRIFAVLNNDSLSNPGPVFFVHSSLK